jgi:hypothetical protein
MTACLLQRTGRELGQTRGRMGRQVLAATGVVVAGLLGLRCSSGPPATSATCNVELSGSFSAVGPCSVELRNDPPATGGGFSGSVRVTSSTQLQSLSVGLAGAPAVGSWDQACSTSQCLEPATGAILRGSQIWHLAVDGPLTLTLSAVDGGVPSGTGTSYRGAGKLQARFISDRAGYQDETALVTFDTL